MTQIVCLPKPGEKLDDHSLDLFIFIQSTSPDNAPFIVPGSAGSSGKWIKVNNLSPPQALLSHI